MKTMLLVFWHAFWTCQVTREEKRQWEQNESLWANSLTAHARMHAHLHTCTACLSYRDMEFIGEGRELVPDAAFPLVEAPCWFCSPSVSMAAEETEDRKAVHQSGRNTHYGFSVRAQLMKNHPSLFLTNTILHRACTILTQYFTRCLTDIVLVTLIWILLDWRWRLLFSSEAFLGTTS